MTYSSLHDPDHLYFMTASICGWKHLFTDPLYANIILDSLSWMHEKKFINLFVYVIMPSHMHMIIKPEDMNIGQLLQKFGSFTAHVMLKQLQQQNRDADIEFFHSQKRDRRHHHSIWQDIQMQNIYSLKFLWQKMEYIHNNPINKDWNLASDRADYAYSSACYYDRGNAAMIEIDDVREWLLA